MRMISVPRRKATSGAKPAVAARATSRVREPANKAMDPEASSGPASAGIHDEVSVIVAEPGWRRLVRGADMVAARAARAAGARGTVVLAADRMVKRLNARHRGRNVPTNVLS